MILMIRTDAPESEISLAIAKQQLTYKWLADRSLAKELLMRIESFIEENQMTFEQLKGIIVYRGPGSFTGLRIGCTVANTLAYGLDVPIVGTVGSEWQQQGLSRLASGDDDQLVTPEYGASPHITQPRR